MTRERRGTAFDPDIADAVLSLATKSTFWTPLAEDSIHDPLMAMRPAAAYDDLDPAQVDGVCEVLADFADAKCRRTWHHSERVAGTAREIALAIGLSPSKVSEVWRAGLVHDIGKAAVPVGILEKATTSQTLKGNASAHTRITRRPCFRESSRCGAWLEVLRLVAEGSTAKDIAGKLVISRKTAEHHMENIYDKLGVTSRTAAAVYAVTNGLV